MRCNLRLQISLDLQCVRVVLVMDEVLNHLQTCVKDGYQNGDRRLLLLLRLLIELILPEVDDLEFGLMPVR